MFTGIIRQIGTIRDIKKEGSNVIFDLEAPFEEPIQVDQSISHNGVCLTVTRLFPASQTHMQGYSVTAVEETLQKSNFGELQVGDTVNLELSMKIGDRLDGHFVQGHVDDTGIVKSISDHEGSWSFTFGIDAKWDYLLVNKGSICINGVSLTVVESHPDRFSVAIIPYTYQHTNFSTLQAGDRVNLEFDILGKYLAKMYRRSEV
ncbi:MAG: riboflavin synthase [Bacteroidota bacterium]